MICNKRLLERIDGQMIQGPIDVGKGYYVTWHDVAASKPEHIRWVLYRRAEIVGGDGDLFVICRIDLRENLADAIKAERDRDRVLMRINT